MNKRKFNVCYPETYSKGYQGQTGTAFHRIGTAFENPPRAQGQSASITIKLGVPVTGLKELVLFEETDSQDSNKPVRQPYNARPDEPAHAGPDPRVDDIRA